MKAGIFFGPPRVICVGRLFQVAFSANEESRPVADLRDRCESSKIPNGGRKHILARVKVRGEVVNFISPMS